MRWRAMTVAMLVALSGVAASVPLIPGERELAFVRFKDRLYDTARAELEAQLADGDLSASVVRPLAELYLQYADVDSAILLLERFVAEHPDDLAARRLLGTYYQFGQRPYDYLRNLEQVAARQPTEAVLRELADIYSWMDEPQRQIATLEQLDAMGRASADDLVGLARLRAARGGFDAAVAALDRAESLAPGTLDADGLELLTALLADAGRADEALSRLSRSRAVRADRELAVRLAATLHSRGQADHAARLLSAFDGDDLADPRALAALTQAETDAGLADRALARLARLLEQGGLPAELRPVLVELAVFQNQLDLAWRATDAGEPAALPPGVLSRLVAASYAQGRSHAIQTLIDRVGDAVLVDVPLVAARLALDRGDLTAARRWKTAADAQSSRSPDDEVALAALERDLGDPDAAYRRLRRQLASRTATVWGVEVFAQVALLTGQSRDGVALVAPLRPRLGQPADEAWARLATAAGQSSAVLTWLRSKRDLSISTQALRDVAYLALDAGAVDLGLETARRVNAREHTRDDRLLLARALVDANLPGEATAVLRPLAASDRAAAAMLEAALARLAPTNVSAREELVRLAQRELASPAVTAARRAEWARTLLGVGAAAAALPIIETILPTDTEAWLSAYVDAAQRTRERARATAFLARELSRRPPESTARGQMVRALIDLGAASAAEPHLRDLALEEGGSWVFLYDEVLASRGRRGPRVELWRHVGADSRLASADRRAAAFRLLELRDKPGAEQVLLSLAADEPPDGPSVAQLLHLWGPRPPRAALTWLEQRATQASSAIQAHWLRHLNAVGAAARVISIIGSAPPASDAPRLAVWIEALRSLEDRVALARTIAETTRTSRDADQLTWLAGVALAESLPDAAARAYESLLAQDPRALEARRWLGLRALATHDLVGGLEHLEHYVAAGGRDPETLLRYGEALARADRPATARRVFLLALDESERRGLSSPEARRTHAFLLAHTGRTDAARLALETLVRERPTDTHLRADYAAWLLAEGLHDEARRILDLR